MNLRVNAANKPAFGKGTGQVQELVKRTNELLPKVIADAKSKQRGLVSLGVPQNPLATAMQRAQSQLHRGGIETSAQKGLHVIA